MNFLDKTYILNLDKYTEKFERTKSELKLIGVNDIIRFSALTHKNETYKPYENARMGCVKSHLSILKNAYDSNYSHVLVVEDDCEFIRDHLNQFDLNEIELFCKNNTYDIFYLGASFIRHEGAKLRSVNIRVDEIRGPCFATHSYIINVKRLTESLKSKLKCDELNNLIDDIENLVENTFNVEVKGCSIDGIYNLLDLRRYIFNPILAIQYKGFSDINQEYLEYRLFESWRDISLNYRIS